MKKRGEMAVIAVLVVATIIVIATAYFSATSIDRNINYIGDSRSRYVYSTLECLDIIQKIPLENRVGFQSIESIKKENYLLVERCKNE